MMDYRGMLENCSCTCRDEVRYGLTRALVRHVDPS